MAVRDSSRMSFSSSSFCARLCSHGVRFLEGGGCRDFGLVYFFLLLSLFSSLPFVFSNFSS